MGPRRRALKSATEAAHGALDRSLGPITDRAAYLNYLRVMTAFRIGVEGQLAKRSANGPVSVLELSGDLVADCQDLQVIAPPAPPFELGDRDEDVMGTLYVLEGSALGARVLIGQAEALGLDATFGARHLARQVKAGDRWVEFQAILETTDGLDVDALIAAALRVFAFGQSVAEAELNAESG